MIATIILATMLMQKIPGKEQTMALDYNYKVEAFCDEYGLAYDDLDHPNSILCADGSRAFVSDKEIELLEQVVAAEARGESIICQEAVATVILNRWQEGSYGETLSDVMLASGQFAAPYQGEISMSVHLAVKNALVYYGTYCQDIPSEVLYFSSYHYHDFGVPYRTIGNLYFSCREGVII